MSNTDQKPNNTPATTSKNQPVTTVVMTQVQRMMENKTLFLPGDFVVENALKAAWFSIQNSDNKDKILACTPESQINALYDMVIQAMDVSKKQGYFIPYGQRLTFQRSYFGDEALAKRVRPGIEIYCDVIYKGDEFSLGKERNRYGMITVVGKHNQAFPRTSNEIIGAYCGIVDENGEDMGIELMTMDQIKQSWKKSKTYGAQSQTFHNEQPDIACKRTVLRRRVKPIINASSDKALLDSIARQDTDSILAESNEVADENANKGEPLAIAQTAASTPQVEDRPAATAAEEPGNTTTQGETDPNEGQEGLKF